MKPDEAPDCFWLPTCVKQHVFQEKYMWFESQDFAQDSPSNLRKSQQTLAANRG